MLKFSRVEDYLCEMFLEISREIVYSFFVIVLQKQL